MQNAKLADVETKLRRWHTRLTVAANKIAKLERQRRRLWTPPTPPKPAAAVAVTEPTPPTEADDPLKVPKFLDRSDPLIAERMTAARKKAEEAARHKMPLTGRAALDAVKRPKCKAAS